MHLVSPTQFYICEIHSHSYTYCNCNFSVVYGSHGLDTCQIYLPIVNTNQLYTGNFEDEANVCAAIGVLFGPPTFLTRMPDSISISSLTSIPASCYCIGLEVAGSGSDLWVPAINMGDLYWDPGFQPQHGLALDFADSWRVNQQMGHLSLLSLSLFQIKIYMYFF